MRNLMKQIQIVNDADVNDIRYEVYEPKNDPFIRDEDCWD